MKYMVIKDGVPAFYAEDIHGPSTLPDGSANPDYPPGGWEISDEAWMDFLEHQSFRVWNPNKLAFDPFTPPPPPPVVPEVISDRQCFQQAAILGKITPDEALAAVTVGALPKVVADGIASLPADQQFGAKMLLCGATEFHRSHPMTPTFLAMIGLGAADRDPFWTAAALL